MPKKLGLLPSVAYSVGGIIGSGIFVAPTSVLLHSGSAGLSLCLWVIGGIVCAIGALVYVELGSCIPETGGGFAYQTRAGWHFLAIPFFWLGALFTCPMMLAIQFKALGQLVVQTLDYEFKISSLLAQYLQWIFGFGALVFIAFLNMFALDRYAARFQILLTAIKVLVVLTLITIGVVHIIGYGPSLALKEPFKNSTQHPFELVLGLYASLFSYSGWEALNTAGGEIKNPRFVLPIACVGGIFLCCLMYVGLNIAYFSVISTDEFVKSSAIAVLFSSRTLGSISFLIPLIIALLMLSNLNSTLFATSRYMYAGAIKHALPTGFSSCNRRHLTPRVSIIAQVLLALILSLLGDLDELISYMSYAELLDRLSVLFALFYMRYKKFDFGKNVYVNPIFVPFIYLVICFALLAIPLYQNYKVAVFALATITISFICYLILFRLNFRPKIFSIIDSQFYRLVHCLLNVENICEAEEKKDLERKFSTSSTLSITLKL